MRSITQLCALLVHCVRLHFGGYLTPGSQEEPEWEGLVIEWVGACVQGVHSALWLSCRTLHWEKMCRLVVYADTKSLLWELVMCNFIKISRYRLYLNISITCRVQSDSSPVWLQFHLIMIDTTDCLVPAQRECTCRHVHNTQATDSARHSWKRGNRGKKTSLKEVTGQVVITGRCFCNMVYLWLQSEWRRFLMSPLSPSQRSHCRYSHPPAL